MSSRQLQIVARVKDEATSEFAKIGNAGEGLKNKLEKGGGVFSSFKQANLEKRQSGEGAFESTLKGAGPAALAVMAVEAFGKAADAARESLDGFNKGTLSGSEAVGSFVEKFRDSIPILGTFAKSFDSIRDASEDGAASFAKWLGLSDSFADKLKSESSRMKEFQALSKAQTEGMEGLKKLREAGAVIGKNPYDAQRIKAEQEYDRQRADLEKKLADALKTIDLDDTNARNAINKTYAAEMKQLQENFNRQTEEDERKHGVEMAALAMKQGQEFLSHQRIILNAQKESDASYLEAAGESNAAKKLLLENAANQELEAAKARHDQLVQQAQQDRRPELIKGYDQNLATERLNIQWKYNRDLNLIRTEEENQYEDQQDRIKAIQQKAQVEMLEASGQHNAAQLLQLKQSGEDQIAALDQQWKRKVALLHQVGKAPSQADKNLYDSERKALQALNAADAKKALHDMGAKDNSYSPASLNEDFYGRGLQPAYSSGSDVDEGVEAQKETAKTMAEVRDFLKEYLGNKAPQAMNLLR